MKTKINRKGEYVIKDVNLNDVFNLSSNYIKLTIELLKKFREENYSVPVKYKGDNYEEEVIRPVEDKFKKILSMLEDSDIDYYDSSTREEELDLQFESAFKELSKILPELWI